MYDSNYKNFSSGGGEMERVESRLEGGESRLKGNYHDCTTYSEWGDN